MLPERPYRKCTDTLSGLKRQIAMGLDRGAGDEGDGFETPPMMSGVSLTEIDEWECRKCGCRVESISQPSCFGHPDDEHELAGMYPITGDD